MTSGSQLFLKSFSGRITNETLHRLGRGYSFTIASPLPSANGEWIRIYTDSLKSALRVGIEATQTVQDCTASTSEADLPAFPSHCFSKQIEHSREFVTGRANTFLPQFGSKLDPSLRLVADRQKFVSTHSTLFEMFQRRLQLLERTHSNMINGPLYLPITTSRLPFSDMYSTLEEANNLSRDLFREYMYSFYNHFFLENKIPQDRLLPDDFELMRMAIDYWSSHYLYRAFHRLNTKNTVGAPFLADLTCSIHVKGEKVNASRFAMGSALASTNTEMQDLMRSICRQRGVPWLDQYQPYGIGYDLGKNIMKVYYICKKEQAPKHLLALAPKDKEYRDQLLISYSYNLSDSQVQEEKLYVYPTGTEVAILLASKRGALYQIDTTPSDEEILAQKYIDSNTGAKIWLEKLNNKGKNLLRHYEAQGTIFDAIEYENPNNFSLYFPFY